MSEINAPATLTTPAGTVSFNPASPTSNYYFLTNVDGLDQAPVRATVDDKPQADGGILYTSLRGARHITIEGLVVSASGVSNRGTMCDALLAALDSIVDADGSWAWTPSGQTEHALTVRGDVAVKYSGGGGGGPKSFIFGLVAADPTITIA
jgi:hypothetical protein